MAKVNIETPSSKPLFMVCPRCGNKLNGNQFYSWKGRPGDVLPMCKECLYSYCINANGLSRDGIINASRYMDLPYVENHYQSIANGKTSDKWKLAQYFNRLRGDLNMRDCHFKDSVFDYIEDYNKVEEEVVDLRQEFTPTEDNEEERLTTGRVSKTERFKELQAKWGNYQSLDFLERCERLYTEMVEGGYQILSAMHHNSLITYVQLQIKWNMAMESDDFTKLKELKQPLNDARNAAKVTVQQLKASDLSNGGANSFGEIAKIVARKDGFIPLPMKYIKQPNDHLDFMMWEIVNYLRHCIGQEEVPYEEIMAHYQKRVDKFNEEFNADIENGDYGELDVRTKGNKKNKHFF